jgi:hypothetical protein
VSAIDANEARLTTEGELRAVLPGSTVLFAVAFDHTYLRQTYFYTYPAALSTRDTYPPDLCGYGWAPGNSDLVLPNLALLEQGGAARCPLAAPVSSLRCGPLRAGPGSTSGSPSGNAGETERCGDHYGRGL